MYVPAALFFLEIGLEKQFLAPSLSSRRRMLLDRVDVFENLSAMGGRIDIRIGFHDDSVLIDEIRDPLVEGLARSTVRGDGLS